MQLVDLSRLPIGHYRGVVEDRLLDELGELARALKGARVLHVSATPYGGGVAELLRSEVALLRGLGLRADWKVIQADESFFEITKGIHNALQGGDYEPTQEAKEVYLAQSRRSAERMEAGYDFVVVHDPQPAALRSFRRNDGGKWVWRCHIDTSEPNEAVWSFLKPFVEAHDAAVFTMREFVPPDLRVGTTEIVVPAIDALSPKNVELPLEVCRLILRWVGIDLERPLICQVARFDPWKDPHGVFDAYRLAKEEVPELQLALVGSMALDDPEGWRVYSEILEREKDDPDASVFTNLTGVGNVEVNALQRLSRVVIQKSIREGFGLVVSEALWKGTAVIGGRAGGIPLQLDDGESGYLVDSVEQCAERIVELVRDSDRAGEMGARGRRRVAERFLMPRLIRDELRLLAGLA